MAKPIVLATKEVEHIIAIEKYGKEEPEFMLDVVLMVDKLGMMELMVIDKIDNKVVDNINIGYGKKLREIMTKEGISKYKIKNLYGMWSIIDKESGYKLLTIFMDIEDTKGLSYIVQLNQPFGLGYYMPAEVTNVECEELWKTDNKVVGLLKKEGILFNDKKSIATMEVYIMYIEKGKRSVSNKAIKGVKVLVGDEEKEEFAKEYNINKELLRIGSMYPIVDIWSSERPWLYQVPSDTKDVKFDFSRGLMWTRFKERSERIYENYKM